MKQKPLFTGFSGAPSLLVIFGVLFLTVLTLLTWERAHTGQKAAERAAQHTAQVYAAQCESEEILAALRMGEVPDGVTFADGIYRYSCRISDTQRLESALTLDENGNYTILSCRSVSTIPVTEDNSPEIWDGDLSFGDNHD